MFYKSVFAKGESQVSMGQFFMDQPFLCEDVQKNGENIEMLLSDKTGQIRAELSLSAQIDTEEIIEKVVIVCGSLWKDNGELILKVKEVRPAKEGEYKTLDVIPGISLERQQEYLKEIGEMISLVRHEGYGKLLRAAFSGEFLEKFVLLPASLSGHGVYRGGLLAATTTIARMAIDTGKAYVVNTNRIYSSNINWDRLITAALLQGFGNLNYITCDLPFRKTQVGIFQGYQSTLQSVLQEVMKKKGVSIEESDMAVLYNIMSATDMYVRSTVRAATKEGLILENAFHLYSECDHFDKVKSSYSRKDDETVFYSRELKAYVSLD